MRVWTFASLLPLLLLSRLPSSPPYFLSPRPGEILRGVVAIHGNNEVEGFASAEVAFTYSAGLKTWFLIATHFQPVRDDLLATWDTTVITDGEYTLRLRVYLVDGTYRDAFVSEVRIRNYLPVETDTPIPGQMTEGDRNFTLESLVTPLPSPTPVPLATPTPLPGNPSSLSRRQVYTSLSWGVVSMVGLFSLFGLYLRLRRGA